MGQRANMVLVSGGEWSLYYDHWCANRLDVELFWGPELAATFVQSRQPLLDREDWLDEVWCEGGAVMDHDERVLLWFGGEDIFWDVELRRAFLPLIRKQWPGWDVRWAAEGVAELGAYLGLPLAKFLARPAAVNATRGFVLLTNYPENNDTLVTVTEKGRTTATRLNGDIEAMEYGASQLPALLNYPLTESLDWEGEAPRAGMHLDLETKRMFWWCAHPLVDAEARIRRRWPDWECVWLRDRFEAHLQIAAAPIRLLQRETVEVQRQTLKRIRRCCTRAASNPVRELGPLLGATAINPWTDAARGSVGDEQAKLRLLDDLERQLPI